MINGSILQRLRDAHTQEDGGKRTLNFGVYYKNTLVALCHALEDSILTQIDCQPLMIAAFQRGKWYLQEANRYRDLAERSRQVVILAAPETGFRDHPTSQQPNVALVDLSPDDPVAQEWHLIILSPQYTAMVLCQELSDDDYGVMGRPTEDLSRKFYGFWTFEPELVLEAAALAIDHIARLDPDLHATLCHQQQEIDQQIKFQEVPCCQPSAEHLGETVSRVVDYLHTNHSVLAQIVPEQPQNSLTYQGLDNNLMSNELQAFLRMAQLIDQTDLRNPGAGAEVATLAEAIGQLLDLPAWQLHRLRLAGLLHRLGFLQSTSADLSAGRAGHDADEPPREPLTCPLVPGTQILRTMPRLRAIATIITHQTEWWNGTGTPAGLSGDAIPLESRILALVAEFQRRVTARRALTPGVQSPDDWHHALKDCASDAGDRWDPKLFETLTLLVQGLSQGWSLSVSPPKIAAGLWLLDSHSDDDLLESLWS